MKGTLLVSYQRGTAKVYLPNGAQSPKLFDDEVDSWIELGGDWVRHALDDPPLEAELAFLKAELEADLADASPSDADLDLALD